MKKEKKSSNYQFFNNKSILVTGGTGLIGRAVVKILCDANANVKIVSLDDIIVDERKDILKMHAKKPIYNINL